MNWKKSLRKAFIRDVHKQTAICIQTSPHSPFKSAHSQASVRPSSILKPSSATQPQFLLVMVDDRSSSNIMAGVETQLSMKSNERDQPTGGIKISAEGRATFASILAIINLDDVSRFASTVRQSGHQSTANKLTGTMASHNFISCKVNPAPFSGSYNIVFAIEFSDGISWMLKVPANGHGQQFDELASKSLVAEARTMQMIKSATTIPVPGVYAFDASLDNELRMPFILMEQIDGISLDKGWFNEGCSKAQLEKFRARALQSLVSAMAQLNRFMLDRGGSIVFNSEGKAVGVGGAKVLDANAAWYREDDDPDENDISCEKGPFTDPKSSLLFMLNRRPFQTNDNAYVKGIYKLLRMLIDWAYERDNHKPRFVLSHPDFDMQNVLVAQDGTLRGLIDWDGVAAVPREVGAAQYPMWLMNDWIESQYDYNIKEGKPREEAGYDESSPDELSCYRAMYAQFMEQEITLNTKESAHLTINGTTPKEEADVTRRSLVMRNLEIATNSPMVTSDIVHHILALIVDLTDADWEDGVSGRDSSSSMDGEIEIEANECDEDGAVVNDISGGRNSSETNICSDSNEGSDTKATEMGNLDQLLAADNSAHGFDKDVISTNTSVSEPSTLNEADFRKQENASCAGINCNETSSSSLSWTRKILRSVCSTAEKTLRRVAKIGYVSVQHNAVDESTQVVADLDKIPARKNKLLEKATAKKNATGLAGNEAEIKDQEVIEDQGVWDRLAIKVRNSGVPVEILQKYESEIASCIVDTVIKELEVEGEQDQDLATLSDMLGVAGTIPAAARMSENNIAKAESVKMAGESVHWGHTIPNDENLLIIPIEATNSRSSSSPSRVSGIEVLPEDATDGLQGLCRSSTSYPKHVFSRAIVSAAGTWHLTPDSSIVSEGLKEDESIASSHGISFSDTEDKGEGHPEEDTKGKDNRAEAREIGMNEATEEDHYNHRPAYTADSNKDSVRVNPFVHNGMYDPCRGEWVEAIKEDNYSIFDTATADQGVENLPPAEGDVLGGDNESEVSNETGVKEAENEVEDDPSSGGEDEDSPGQAAKFIDRGRFDPWTILNVLGSGDLDELRMLRLKEGFLKLLEQC